MNYLLFIPMWLVFGLIMGFLARAILPGKQKIGLFPTLLVGAVGSLLGAFVSYQLGIGQSTVDGPEVEVSTFNIPTLIAALVGSLVVLIIWCLITRKNWR